MGSIGSGMISSLGSGSNMRKTMSDMGRKFVDETSTNIERVTHKIPLEIENLKRKN